MNNSLPLLPRELEPNPVLFTLQGEEYRYSAVQQALDTVGIRPGDTIFVHSDLARFGTLGEIRSKELYTAYFLRALLEAVGSSGTLLMPTFTYSFCKGEVYDPQSTPSTVGILTEYFRTRPGVSRSLEGIFSVAGYGAQAQEFLDVGQNCFGAGSIFEKLYENDATLVLLGPTPDLTYVHFIEQRFGVDYRYLRSFPGQILENSRLHPYEFSYFVRDLNRGVEYNLPAVISFLTQAGVTSGAALGASQVRAFSARETFSKITTGLQSSPFMLLKAPPAPPNPEATHGQ